MSLSENPTTTLTCPLQVLTFNYYIGRPKLFFVNLIDDNGLRVYVGENTLHMFSGRFHELILLQFKDEGRFKIAWDPRNILGRVNNPSFVKDMFRGIREGRLDEYISLVPNYLVAITMQPP